MGLVQKRLTQLAALAVLAGAAPATSAQTPATAAQRMAASLAGEWNNNEQVWQQRIDAAKPTVPGAAPVVVAEHVHTVLAPVVLAQLPGAWLYVQRSAGENVKLLRRQALWRLVGADVGAVRLEPYVFNEPTRWQDLHRQSPSALAQLSASELRPEPHCEALVLSSPNAGQWQADAAALNASGHRDCVDLPLQLLASGVLVHGSPGLAGATGTSLRSRKVRYFEGWVWFRNAGPAALPDDKDTSFTAKYALHSEGQKMVLLRKDGSESPWLLELALLTYQNTRRPILKFALVDRASGKSIAYTWANTEASNVGMNLGWFQAGVTQRSESVYFSSPP